MPMIYNTKSHHNSWGGTIVPPHELTGWLPQFHTFPHHWTVSLAKHSPMTVLENLITVWNVKQSVGRHCIFNDAEEV